MIKRLCGLSVIALSFLNVQAAELTIQRSDLDQKELYAKHGQMPKEVVECYRRILSLYEPWKMFVIDRYIDDDNRAMIQQEYLKIEQYIRAWKPKTEKEIRFKKIARAYVHVQKTYFSLSKNYQEKSELRKSFIIENNVIILCYFLEFLREYGIPSDKLVTWAEQYGFGITEEAERTGFEESLEKRAARSVEEIKKVQKHEALVIALHNSHIAEREMEIKALLSDDPGLMNGLDYFNLPPLVYAVAHDDIELAKLLVESCNANPNIRSHSGTICLLHARSEQMRKLLLSAGASINYTGPYKETALMTAADTGSLYVVEALLDDKDINIDAVSEKDGETALIKALKKQEHEIFRLLNQKGASMHIANARGETFLMTACKVGAKTYVKVMLNNGNYNINAVDIDGQTSLMKAVQGGFEEIVDVLLAHGADIDKYTKDGKTVFGYAIDAWVGHDCANHECHHKEILKKLMVEREKLVARYSPQDNFDEKEFEGMTTGDDSKDQKTNKNPKKEQTAREKEFKREQQEQKRDAEQKQLAAANEADRKKRSNQARARKDRNKQLEEVAKTMEIEEQLTGQAEALDEWFSHLPRETGIEEESTKRAQLRTKYQEPSAFRKKAKKNARDNKRTEKIIELEIQDEIEAEELGMSSGAELRDARVRGDEALREHGYQDILDDYESTFPLCQRDTKNSQIRNETGLDAWLWYQNHKSRLLRIYQAYKGLLLCPHCPKEVLMQGH